MFHLDTERLSLKAHSLTNLAKFHAWENDPELLYLNDDCPPGAPPETLEDTRAYLECIASQAEPGGAMIYFAIHTRAEDDFIGYGMIALIDRYNRRCKIGVTIGDRSQWGRGYAGEALQAVIDYCFQELNMNRIGAEIYDFNLRSIRLFEKLGFRREGALRQAVFKDGKFHDELLYGLLRQAWIDRRRPHLA